MPYMIASIEGVRLSRAQFRLLWELRNGPMPLRQWNAQHEATRLNLQRRGYVKVYIRNYYVDSTVEITDEGRAGMERFVPLAQERWGLS